MNTYRCRMVVPNHPEWHEVTADSPESAANDFHGLEYDRDRHGLRYVHETSEDGRCLVFFALVEVEGHETFVSRIFKHGIWRVGRKVPYDSQRALQEIADQLQWKHPLAELVAEGWEGEEKI